MAPKRNRGKMEQKAFRKFYNQFHYEKLRALKFFAKHYSTPSNPPKTITSLEYAQAMDFSMILRDSNDPIQLSAASMGLDIILPQWRDHFPDNILGKVMVRDDRLVARWRKLCFERDGKKCVECGSTEKLAVHHICEWADFPALRIVPDNGKTLCGKCHHANHPKMGKEMFY